MSRVKPQVFVSYASHDAGLANALKARLVAATNNEIEFFLAADGVSIPAGSNWPVRLEHTLEGADVIIVVMSYAAAASQWVFFEAGYAYAKGKPVVPVGVLGLRVELQPPPISLLQGINIDGADGLNLLLRHIGHHVGGRYPETFTDTDYDEVFGNQSAQIPLPRTKPLLSRREVYDDIRREIMTLDVHAAVRVTATMKDSYGYDDPDFNSYLLGMAQKCAAAEAAGGRMTYDVVIGITRQPDGSIPPALWRAISHRVHVFEERGALRRMALFEIPQRWSLNLLFFNRSSVIFGFPDNVDLPRLQHGFRASGMEFVSPLVDWFDRIKLAAAPLPVDQFL